ncbi:unnamed protein product [Triticum turgidum subsp. durum]|uniref:GDSL esterase/lipase n=1 Tax=Triticum turgidum subsp. durum TaxID=4567 RepID=A0A9R1RZA7_TRITD|nr:unnamed protein product [Triticum turgidum subsp. durum]
MGMGADPFLPRRPLRQALRLHLQLRRLLRRNRQQPRRLRRQLRLQPCHAPTLRLHLLRPPHRPQLRRPPHHRLHRYGVPPHSPLPSANSPDLWRDRLEVLNSTGPLAAQRLGLPLVPPSLAHNGSFRQGANFAVGGATALDAAFFHDGSDPGNKFPLNTSLGVQLQWFEALKPSLCRTTQECEAFFGRSLFFVGEFGVNDYHFSFPTKSLQEITAFVPEVIRAISMAIERLIKHGATSFVVPGTIPSGCTPHILSSFAKDDPAEYNSTTGCLEDYNKLGMHHNLLLQEALEKLRGRHPDAMIVYADLFGPIIDMVESPRKYGFEDVLTNCCGGPGALICGDQGAHVCEKPAARLFWDVAHLTEAAYRYIADGWLGSIDSPATARESRYQLVR